MFFAAATNFLLVAGNPDPQLRRLAEAGFTHLLWGHQWNTDFLYNAGEISAVRKALRRHHLILQDVHGSRGVDKNWYSELAYERKSGVELVRNRLRLLCECEAVGVLVMHPPRRREKGNAAETKKRKRQTDALRRSLDELLPALETADAQIALENLPGHTWEILREILPDYPAERIGVCLDTGHANLSECPQWDDVKEHASRIIAVHLHDNDGGSDQHLPPGYGTVPWDLVLKILKDSPYRRPLTFEAVMQQTPWYDKKRTAREQRTSRIRNFLSDMAARSREIAEQFKMITETAQPETK